VLARACQLRARHAQEAAASAPVDGLVRNPAPASTLAASHSRSVVRPG
jgi:hypothetical protein